MGWKQYFVYMMTNRWLNVLYTGVTNSLERRVWQHKHGAVRGFTKKYNCDRLAYYEEYDEILQRSHEKSRSRPGRARRKTRWSRR